MLLILSGKLIMPTTYKYLYTYFGIFGSLPTHKIFLNLKDSNKSKFIFADNTFIYGIVSDWVIRNSDFDTRASTWDEEKKYFIDNETRLLNKYRKSHPLFKTEAVNNI